MTYVEIIVTITAVASTCNVLLQTYWFTWSYGIHERKHFTDTNSVYDYQFYPPKEC